jgi:hypothetical protein
MKYLLLIQHGDIPVPASPEWDVLSEDEQKASPPATGRQPGRRGDSWRAL